MNTEGKKLIEKARNLIEAGEVEEAVYVLQEGARNFPHYPDLHNELGVALSLLGRYTEAINAFKQAIALNPNYIEAHLNLALTLTEMGKRKEAMEEFEKVELLERARGGDMGFSAKAKLANAHKEIACLYMDLGKYKDAIDELEKAFSLAPDFLMLEFYLPRHTWRLKSMRRL